MSAEDPLPEEWILTDAVVREAIELLTSTPTHQQFVLYLQLRRAAVEESRFTGLAQSSDVIARWLDIPGGPPDKPYFRPFVSSKRPNASAFWMNRNLAGSYAPSSLRPEWKALFVGPDGGYRLPTLDDGSPDPAPIVEKLLLGSQLPAWALAAFLFRNWSIFVSPEGSVPDVEVLLRVFQDHFDWTSEDETHVGERSMFDWDARPHSGSTFHPRDGRAVDRASSPVMDVGLASPLPSRDAASLGVGYSERLRKATAAPDAPDIDVTDPAITEVVEVLEQYWGVILSGPPGTSKSHRASAVARALADFDPKRYAFTQFHQSYQFDDFIEGYRPRETKEGGFERRDGVFAAFCRRARKVNRPRFCAAVMRGAALG